MTQQDEQVLLRSFARAVADGVDAATGANESQQCLKQMARAVADRGVEGMAALKARQEALEEENDQLRRCLKCLSASVATEMISANDEREQSRVLSREVNLLRTESDEKEHAFVMQSTCLKQLAAAVADQGLSHADGRCSSIEEEGDAWAELLEEAEQEETDGDGAALRRQVEQLEAALAAATTATRSTKEREAAFEESSRSLARTVADTHCALMDTEAELSLSKARCAQLEAELQRQGSCLKAFACSAADSLCELEGLKEQHSSEQANNNQVARALAQSVALELDQAAAKEEILAARELNLHNDFEKTVTEKNAAIGALEQRLASYDSEQQEHQGRLAALTEELARTKYELEGLKFKYRNQTATAVAQSIQSQKPSPAVVPKPLLLQQSLTHRFHHQPPTANSTKVVFNNNAGGYGSVGGHPVDVTPRHNEDEEDWVDFSQAVEVFE